MPLVESQAAFTSSGWRRFLIAAELANLLNSLITRLSVVRLYQGSFIVRLSGNFFLLKM